MEQLIQIVNNGGPSTAVEKSYLSDSLSDIYHKRSNLNCKDIAHILRSSLKADTMQGMAFRKPRGYAGDFEIIERIYARHISNDPRFKKWDIYFHEQAAPKAVRNRKDYFKTLLAKLEQTANNLKQDNNNFYVLNLGSGPCRDLKEYFDENPLSRSRVDCIDMDINAVHYARSLCKHHLNKIYFENRNIFKYNAPLQYDLIWSAGLFDYLTDKQFVHQLGKLWESLAPNGRIVLGNFSESNSSRPYMELVGEWILNHRSAAQLLNMVHTAGIQPAHAFVESEQEGVNLFLHIVK